MKFQQPCHFHRKFKRRVILIMFDSNDRLAAYAQRLCHIFLTQSGLFSQLFYYIPHSGLHSYQKIRPIFFMSFTSRSLLKPILKCQNIFTLLYRKTAKCQDALTFWMRFFEIMWTAIHPISMCCLMAHEHDFQIKGGHKVLGNSSPIYNDAILVRKAKTNRMGEHI